MKVRFNKRTAVATFVVRVRCSGRKITVKVYRKRRRWSVDARKRHMKRLHAK